MVDGVDKLGSRVQSDVRTKNLAICCCNKVGVAST